MSLLRFGIFLFLPFFIGCSAFRITEKRVKGSEALLLETANLIVEKAIFQSKTKSIKFAPLKKNLRKLNVDEIYLTFKSGRPGMDSVVVLSLYTPIFHFEEIIIDISKRDRILKNYRQIHKRIYYHQPFPLS